ncbi:FAD-binding dehydrogenase [Diaminobutyricimonas sp. TR449]|uniref:FAD-binding dehydrogenase n=1 Tax=Diaminobutyricimonas sp. TR449 TaxID=2708076 RepID=UPI001FBB24D5|nr:FAD-binding dehydrogenase [Diaminobutyricimonas sp. TR449]
MPRPTPGMTGTFDTIIIGAGLAGLVTAAELLDAGRRVIILEQEPEASLGGQAWWSFGGLFLVNSPEQRRMGVRDSHALARQDWHGTAGFDREDDDWGRAWAEAYVAFAANEKRDWLAEIGVKVFPIVGWAERGGGGAAGPGNSVPRFHIVWGTGPALLAPFIERVRVGIRRGMCDIRYRHKADGLVVSNGAVVGVRGTVLRPDNAGRGFASNREVVDEFELHSRTVVVASGGIGGNHDLVREFWPSRMGTPPASMLSGVPAHVDGRMLGIAEAAGARLVNRDRMWHYTEGITNWNPVWAGHGIRILPGPSSLWFDARGRRLPGPLYPGFDTLGTLAHLRRVGYDHSWFVLTQKIIEKEFALSGSEQNPDLTGRSIARLLRRLGPGAPGPVEAFKKNGSDFVVADTLDELFGGMQALSPDIEIDLTSLRTEIESHDRALDNRFGKDSQLTAVRAARHYRGDRLIRVASPHRILDRRSGPLIAVKLHTLTRKTLGGLQTDLSGRVLGVDKKPMRGLYAVGEAAGFGGGGMHGYRSLEGTFLGGCLFTGRVTGRAISASL